MAVNLLLHSRTVHSEQTLIATVTGIRPITATGCRDRIGGVRYGLHRYVYPAPTMTVASGTESVQSRLYNRNIVTYRLR